MGVTVSTSVLETFIRDMNGPGRRFNPFLFCLFSSLLCLNTLKERLRQLHPGTFFKPSLRDLLIGCWAEYGQYVTGAL